MADGAATRRDATTLYLHGVPTSSDDWVGLPARYTTRPWWKRWWRPMRRSDEWMEVPEYSVGFLERSGGLAVDLPGFGRSGKPGYLTYTIAEYVRFLERFLDLVEVERVRLVMHDWGVVGLAFAQAHPERVERLVLINTVPLLPDYRWHRIARIWRTPLLGELVMGSTNRLDSPPSLEGGKRHARAAARGVARHRARPLRPGHLARDPPPLPQLPARGARGRRRATRRADDAGARGLGSTGPLHPRPLRLAPTPRRSAVPPTRSS